MGQIIFYTKVQQEAIIQSGYKLVEDKPKIMYTMKFSLKMSSDSLEIDLTIKVLRESVISYEIIKVDFL